MANATYMDGRQKYARPQAILFADNPGTISTDGKRIPDGYEIGSEESSGETFLILSDHNRGPIEVKVTRIEKRERMVNGRMRSYHIADKLSINLSWTMIPSRAFSSSPEFNPSGYSPSPDQYTADGGAGGSELLNWYENNTGSFWVYLSYDKPQNFSSNEYGRLSQYSHVVEMFFADFSYSVQKRGGSNHDLWNVSLTLEEV
jgi:hypothetical protein